MKPYSDATAEEIDSALQRAQAAFTLYREKGIHARANLLRSIAFEMGNMEDALTGTAKKETNLDADRLATELRRTMFQLTSYADACAAGLGLDVRIDTPPSTWGKGTSKVDLRKMGVPLGPVVVFGASNFPFAYSTAGGDTACALAAGCSVIVKAHPAHPATSEMVAGAIRRALISTLLPKDIFIHLHGASFETGKALVNHPLTKAVGFTGSFEGGKALFDLASRRENPIPVFAEMGSVNPVFLLPKKLEAGHAEIAKLYAASITQSVGQFCTNPGILVAIDGPALEKFSLALAHEMDKIPSAKMLHAGIAGNYQQKKKAALEAKGIQLRTTAHADAVEGEPTLAETHAENFLKNPALQQEVFGPFSLLVTCKDMEEMMRVAQALHGQLTATVMGTDEELAQNQALLSLLRDICGRFICNGVPTGVEVALAMQHGGPFPATTDSRFTAVGADGIRRFTRPLCFQNWPDALLPDELKNENPLHILRMVNHEWTTNKINR